MIERLFESDAEGNIVRSTERTMSPGEAQTEMRMREVRRRCAGQDEVNRQCAAEEARLRAELEELKQRRAAQDALLACTARQAVEQVAERHFTAFTESAEAARTEL